MRRWFSLTLFLLLMLSFLIGCGAEVKQSVDDAEPPVAEEAVEETVEEGEVPQEEALSIDPASTVLPDLELFLRSRPYEGKPIEYVSGAYEHKFVWLPRIALEDVTAEVATLLSQPQYRLTLREMKEGTYYGWEVDSYYYDYTGSGVGVTEVPNKYDEGSIAPVILMIADDKVEGCFHLSLFYSPVFELQDSGTRSSRNLTEDGQGEIITEDTDLGEYESSSDTEQWREKCSACHGSGDCTHCGGDDTVKKFQAGIGYVSQDCTFCSGGRCRSCGGDGWK